MTTDRIDSSWEPWLRELAVVVAWAASFYALSRWGVELLPKAVTDQLSLQGYLLGVQVVALAIGVGVAATLLVDPRGTLGLRAPSGRVIGAVLLVAPAVFVLATGSAFLAARETLLEELRTGGRELAQRSTGEFGRQITEAPAWSTLLWGAIVSPIAEELFFRGALWGLVRGAVARLLTVKAGGWAATLVVTAAFGFLHWDMPGGLGIVRLVAALGLGLACGLLRQLSGTLVAPIALHVIFNALSVATARRWVVTADFPTKYSVPTLVAVVAAVLLVALAAIELRGRTASEVKDEDEVIP